MVATCFGGQVHTSIPGGANMFPGSNKAQFGGNRRFGDWVLDLRWNERASRPLDTLRPLLDQHELSAIRLGSSPTQTSQQANRPTGYMALCKAPLPGYPHLSRRVDSFSGKRLARLLEQRHTCQRVLLGGGLFVTSPMNVERASRMAMINGPNKLLIRHPGSSPPPTNKKKTYMQICSVIPIWAIHMATLPL